MLNTKRAILITILVCQVAVAVGQRVEEKDKVTCLVKVVDGKGQPVAGAEVAAYEDFFDYAGGQVTTELLGKTTNINKDGIYVLNTNITNRVATWIVARKEGLAFAWNHISQFAVDQEITFMLEEPCVLAGTVVDEVGRGIVGARVRMLPTHFMLSGPSVALEAPDSWLTTETDANGGFCFSNVPAEASADFLVTAPGKASGDTFMALDNSPGYRYAAGRTDIRIVLPPEAKIQGRVVDPVGNPVAGVRLLARPNKIVAKYHCTNRAVSAHDGRFLFEGVSADTYSLQVVAPRDTMAQWVGKDVKVVAKAGQTTDDIAVRVSKGGFVEVVVRNAATNRLVEGVWATVFQGASFGRCPCFFQVSKTDHYGRVRMRAPLGQCYVVAGGGGYSRFQSDPPVDVAKEKTARMNVLLYPDPEVSGIVRDQFGRVVPGVTVAVVPSGYCIDRTDEDGRFEITYRRESERRYLFARDTRRNLASAVEIKDRTRPMNIVLKPALTLVGRITDPNGNSIPAARVQLAARLSGWFAYVGAEVFTGTDGRYDIPAVPPQPKDIYYINVIATGYCPLHLEEISLAAASANRADLDSFVLQPLNMSILGVVVDAEGRPAAGKKVSVRGPHGAKEGQPGRSTVTDVEGKFTINRIFKGPLRLQAGDARDKDVGFLEAKAGDRDVKIVLGQSDVHRPYVSLVGRPLFELKDLKVELSEADASGKIVLVCFWDMNQRPSRRCIIQLAKQAQQLKQKGVAVIAVQASKVDERTLNEWVKKYEISFPVGMVQGNEEKTGFTWGVRSLPWLILTDRQHIVTAEGFSLADLNDKIKMSSDF